MENQIHTRSEIITLIQSLTGQTSVLTVPRELSRFLGDDLPAALLLSQLIYWQGKQGRADGAIYKTYAEWYEEIGLTEYQVRRATKKMSEFLRTKIHRANGSPTVHYYLNVGQFSESILKFLKERNRSFSRNETEVSQDSLTETTAKTTPETTTGIEEEGEGSPLPAAAAAAAVIDLFKQNFPDIAMTPIIAGKLRDLVRDFPPAWVKEAISAACEQRARAPIPYMRTFLENKRKKPAPTDGKFHFDSAPHVLVTEEEVLDLVERFGNDGAAARINFISRHKGSTGEVYKSDYETILKWDARGGWEPETQGWVMDEKWLDSIRPKPAIPGAKTGKATSITLAEWFKLWSEERLKDATVGQQHFYRETIFGNHILPELGAIPLQEITDSDVWQLLDKVPTGGYPGKRPVRRALQECLVGAINEGLLDTNPASPYVDSVCKWCNRVFRAQKSKDGRPPSDHCNRSECVDKDREEWKRASAAPAPA